ncbi:LptF/LptG family permease [Raineya sp.]|jgi:lipopolysaccharide export system permease protein
MPLLRIKKIDWLILKAFVPSFLLTYFVVVFLLLIQMIMSYLDEFVGKDIGAFTFSKMLYYFALSLTPMALPLAVLLSALMAYGNLGEHFELTAIKSAGVSLTRTLRPIGVFALLVSAVSFWFSNKVVPYANIKAYSTLYNVKQTKATLDLKEGIFYDGIPNYSIKVSKKYPDGKSLKNVIIYSHQDFRGNKDVVIADSGRMYTILDGAYLVMELFNGNAYSEHNDGTGQSNVKFIRNQYKKTKLVLSLAAFRKSNISDSLFRYHRLMKNVVELRREIDSFKREIVKAKEKSKSEVPTYYVHHQKPLPQDSFSKLTFNYKLHFSPKQVDSFWQKRFDSTTTTLILQRALNQARSVKGFLEFRRGNLFHKTNEIREHYTELHKKFTFALACFMMFLIGAPLGSIIKKGGLGIPILVSVFFFILYYVVNMLFEKWVKEGVMEAWAMWIPNLIFLVFGIFFFNQARKDSRLFEFEMYRIWFERFSEKFKKNKTPTTQ